MKRKASTLKCPKCKRVGVTRFDEIWPVASSIIPFESINGELVAHDHNSPDVDPAAVVAICQCGHRWKLRGVTQITNIDAG